jgi:hypothetical protein
MARDISNSEDIIDSRDIIARIDELTELLEGADPEDYSDEREELAALQALSDDARSDDWRYGATLIRDSYFQEYAEQLADDIGAIDRNASWPLNFINWEAAADALKADYTSVEFDGVTYWVR